jgi:YHS domain
MLRNRSILIVAAAILATAVLVASRLAGGAGAAQPPVFTGLVEGVDGLRPRHLLHRRQAGEGLGDCTTQYKGATWRFASAENRAAFEADPAKYAPQYGGYCAYAVSQGNTAKAEPDAWTIHDGKLYLNYDKNVQARWEKDIPGYVAAADANWPGILGK